MFCIKIKKVSRPNRFFIPIGNNITIINFNIEIKKVNAIINRFVNCKY